MISLRGVTKFFAGRPVLDSLDFEFEWDAVYVLRGPSGAGKSTLLNVIAGYLRPDRGAVEHRERVGYLMQDDLLFSRLRVSEMLRLRLLGLLASGDVALPSRRPVTATPGTERGGDAGKNRFGGDRGRAFGREHGRVFGRDHVQDPGRDPGRSASWTDANRWLDRLGLTHLRESEIGTLSGGERRRLEIASVMLANPGLLLLDEPTSGLDPANAKTVYSALWKVRGKRTVIIATHETRIPELPYSAHEMYLDHGRVRVSSAAQWVTSNPIEN